MNNPFLMLIVAIIGLTVYLTLKRRFQKEVHLAALEKGVPVKLPQTDLRKPGLVLIALGLGYSISSHVTFSLDNDPSFHPLQFSIWGIVPILIGVFLWIYRNMQEKDKVQGNTQ